MSAFESYQSFMNSFTQSAFFETEQPLSLHPQHADQRFFRRNGLLRGGEVTAADLHAFRDKHNHYIVASTRYARTSYVVFNVPPSLQLIVPAYLRTEEGRRDADKNSRVLSRLAVVGRKRSSAPQLSPAYVESIIERQWAERHPAAQAVEPAAARQFVELMELTGDELQRRLTDIGVLPRSMLTAVDVGAIVAHLNNFCAVVVGERATYPTAPSTIASPLLCTCERFMDRRCCQHSLFTETLDFPGLRDATLSSLSIFQLGHGAQEPSVQTPAQSQAAAAAAADPMAA